MLHFSVLFVIMSVKSFFLAVLQKVSSSLTFSKMQIKKEPVDTFEMFTKIGFFFQNNTLL